MKLITYSAIILIVLAISLWIVKDYQRRMVEVNRHYCVEVYGLDEECE